MKNLKFILIWNPYQISYNVIRVSFSLILYVINTFRMSYIFSKSVCTIVFIRSINRLLEKSGKIAAFWHTFQPPSVSTLSLSLFTVTYPTVKLDHAFAKMHNASSQPTQCRRTRGVSSLTGQEGLTLFQPLAWETRTRLQKHLHPSPTVHWPYDTLTNIPKIWTISGFSNRKNSSKYKDSFFLSS